MKRFLTLLLVLVISILTAACGSGVVQQTEPTQPPKRAVLLQIEAAETFDEITNCYSHVYIEGQEETTISTSQIVVGMFGEASGANVQGNYKKEQE